MTRTPWIGIIGAGMSGLCIAATLKRAGFDDFTIYEKADKVGGTWRDNTYPGVACDVPSALYQFTFDPNPGWSRLLAPGHEIQGYFERVAGRQGLREHLRLGTNVTKAEHVGGRWHLYAGDTEIDVVDFLVAAAGILHHPRYPDIEGLDDFAGAVFHSARWNHAVPLDGKRVGLIGTGSTGAQILTSLAPRVKRLKVFQRTPQWVFPIINPRVNALPLSVISRLPGAGLAGRLVERSLFEIFIEGVTHDGWQRKFINAMVRANLRTVRDPALRAKLTPDFVPLCRRLILATGYYEAMQRANVDVIVEDIVKVESQGIRTADGVLHEFDVLVLATGFDAQAYIRPTAVIGLDGRTLDEAWKAGPRAYKTVAQPGFPNYFMMMGPHSPVGNFSLTIIAETQANYILRWVREWAAGRIDAVNPIQEAADAFNAELREAAKDTVWATGCRSWYHGADGIPELWPWHPERHQEMLSTLEIDEFEGSSAHA
ncbi:MAG: monooxygenase [Moraxellaceae bacterium]|jgi:cation diffusion facilitator CzcD-associated flavoprotein CzcO|nr:monooxygenase [Moraxellaceae bacterium]